MTCQSLISNLSGVESSPAATLLSLPRTRRGSCDPAEWTGAHRATCCVQPSTRRGRSCLWKAPRGTKWRKWSNQGFVGLRPLPGRLVTDSRSALGARRARPHATPFALQHLKIHGPPNSGRSVAEWAPSLKKATDACVLASNNASPAQRGPRRDAQPLHATPLAAVLFPALGGLGALGVQSSTSHPGPGS